MNLGKFLKENRRRVEIKNLSEGFEMIACDACGNRGSVGEYWEDEYGRCRYPPKCKVCSGKGYIKTKVDKVRQRWALLQLAKELE